MAQAGGSATVGARRWELQLGGPESSRRGLCQAGRPNATQGGSESTLRRTGPGCSQLGVYIATRESGQRPSASRILFKFGHVYVNLNGFFWKALLLIRLNLNVLVYTVTTASVT
jgi:hypothetical protein